MNNPNDLTSVVKAHISAILAKYDKNNNANLDKEELRQLLAQSLGVAPATITQDQVDWHFNKIDENKDGKITFQQYFEHFFLKRAKDAKKNSDNQNQLIDIGEFRKLMEDTFKPLNITITQEMVQWNFKQIDKDNSGRISFDQFLKFIKKYNQ